MKTEFLYIKSNYKAAIALAVISSLLAVTGALAAAGALDSSFDYDGIVVNDIGGTDDEVRDIVLMPDGRVVAAGYTNKWGGLDFAVARYNTNGSLDTTFDYDGIVITDIRGDSNYALGVVLQSDNKIVVGGTSGNDFALTRYNVNGSLDASFDGDGIVVTDIGAIDVPYAIAIQSDGRIILAGMSDNLGENNYALARYNTNGSLDASFDGDGIVITDIWDQDCAYGLTIQADGRIVAAGYSTSSGGVMDISLARYNTDGSLDASFDGDGKVATDIRGETNAAWAVRQQVDGRLVAVGYTGSSDFALVRYNTDGSLDPAFDWDGIVVTDLGGSYDMANAMAIQADGKILAAGFSDRLYPNDFALVRYNVNGSLDSTFDGDGIVLTNIGAMDSVDAVVVRPDNRIVVGGTSNHWGDYNFALARYLGGALAYLSNGSQDGWVLESAETSNIGGSLNNVGTVLVVGDGPSRKQYRSIVSFDTSSLPDNAVITSAILRVRTQAIVGSNPFGTLGSLIADMVKGSFYALPLQAADFQAPASKINAGAMTPLGSTWYQLALNPVYYSLVNRTGVTQFRLRFTLDDDNDAVADYVRFYCGDYPNPKVKPVLLIEYYVP